MSIIGFSRPLVLASASPARKALLNDTGLKFTTQTVAIDESANEGEKLGPYCERLARAKASAATPPSNNAVIIGVDTAIGFKGAIIGKAADEVRAEEMLKKFSGKTHEVASAIAVRDLLKDSVDTEVVITKVSFIHLTDGMIGWYLATGEWRDRAGAYAIQGKGAALIAAVDGCFTNVIGLSVPTLLKMLSK